MYNHNMQNTWTKEITLGKHILNPYRMAEVRNILQYKETVCNAYISVRVHAEKYLDVFLIIALYKSSIFHY